MNKMNVLYVSTIPINGHTPQDKRIGTGVVNNKRVWTCGLEIPDCHVLSTYNINTYIFRIYENEIACILQWLSLKGKKIIRIIECTDKATARAALSSDTDLTISIYFDDTIKDWSNL